MRWRSGTLDDLYFEWLYEQIALIRPLESQNYWNLTRELYCIEFLYFVPNDDNRAMDGLELREEFLWSEDVASDPYWDELPCSIFEMLVALARRVEYQGGGTVFESFWRFMQHMGLDLLHDGVPDLYLKAEVRRAAHALNHRTYSTDGHNGGLFPLYSGEEDQRNVEIWHQMASYLREGV